MSQMVEEPSKSNLESASLNNLADAFKKALKNQDLWEATDVAVKLRNYTDDDQGRKDIMNTGVLKYIVKLVDPRYHSRERLMVQCSWILCNMASGKADCVKHVVRLGVIKRGLLLLKHPNHEVKSNAAWLLANISGENLKYRDMMIKEGVVKQVEWVLKTCAPRPSLMKQMMWLMSNLLRGKPYPRFSEIQVLLKYIAYFLHNSKNTEILANVLQCLSYVTFGDDGQIQLIYDLDVCSKLISLVKTDNYELQKPAISTIGNMLTVTNDQVNLFVQNGVIEVFSEILNHKVEIMRKQACWGLSNIMADDPALVLRVLEFENGKIFKKLMEMCSVEGPQVAKECLYCLGNACGIADVQELDQLVELGVVDVIVSKLNSDSETEELVICLEALNATLDGFSRDPDFDKRRVLLRIAERGGYPEIEKLQNHPDEEVYRIVNRLIESHFDY